MIPRLLLAKRLYSCKKELMVVLGVLIVLLILPGVAVASITNLSALDGSTGEDSISLYTGTYPGDLYDYGNCTYWTAMRRAQVGQPVPNTWGNAATWAFRAALAGYQVDHTPTQYSIMQISDVAKGLGHVAFVESVDPDGTWHISEMNVVGFDEVDHKAKPASAAANYSFIHQKATIGNFSHGN